MNPVVKMKQASGQAYSHSQMIGTSILEISNGAENSSEAIQNTAESVEAASTLALNVQDRAAQSKEKSIQMLETLTNSKYIVTRLVEGIDRLATSNNKLL